MITVSHASRALVARAASLRLLVAILVAGGRVGFQAMIVLAHLVSFHCSPLLAVVSKVVEDVWVGFKDHVLHLDPCSFLQASELFFG